MNPEEEEKFDNSVQFVAQFYNPDVFDKKRAWQRLGVSTPIRWRRVGVAASVAVMFVAAAAYFVGYRNMQSVPTAEPVVKEIVMPAENAPVSTYISFEDENLREVVTRIEEVYGVEIENVPDTEYRVTLSYDGTAEDLVASINELLGTSMRVK